MFIKCLNSGLKLTNGKNEKDLGKIILFLRFNYYVNNLFIILETKL